MYLLINPFIYIFIFILFKPLLVLSNNEPFDLKQELTDITLLGNRDTEELEKASSLIVSFLKKHPEVKMKFDKEVFDYFYQATFIHSKLKRDIPIYGEHALNIASNNPMLHNKHSYQIANLYYWTGAGLSEERKLKEGESYLFEALKIYKNENGDETDIANVYGKLGLNSLYAGNTKKALDMLHKALSIYENETNINRNALSVTYNNIGIAYMNFKDYNNAVIYYDKAQKQLEGLPINKNIGNRRGDLLDHIGYLLLGQGKIEEALESYQRSLQLRQRYNPKKNNLVSDSYDGIGGVYLAKKQYTKALKYYQQSLSLKQKYYTGMHADIAYSYLLMGDFYLETKQYEKAKAFYQTSMSILEKVASRKYELYLRAYIGFGNAHKASHENEKALRLYEEIILLKNSIRREYQNDNSTLDVLNQMSITEDALSLAFELFEESKDSIYLEKVYNILEENQASRLLDALHLSSIKRFSKIPEEQLILGDSLKKMISDAEKKWFTYNESESNLTNDIQTKEYQAVLEARQKWYAYTQDIKENYPDFYKLQLNPDNVKLSEIQKDLLLRKNIIIEYFIGERHIYIIAIHHKDIVLKRIPLDFPLEKWISNIRSFISNSGSTLKQLSPSDIDSLQNNYSEAAYGLYTKLIAPIGESFLKDNDLCIIPDGIIGYIPFDILLCEKPTIIKGFRSLKYLLKKHSISYAFSANSLHFLQKKKTNSTKKILAFSPDFIFKGEHIFPPLKYSIDEVKTIQDLLGAEIHTKKAASIVNFKNLAPNYNILHLSTHGKADDALGDNCFLVFSILNKKKEDYLLYVRDLYNMDLSASMVVLSACETGIGELRKGEGIISLGRGFTYAGAKSIINTLWNVNEKSTNEIMTLFYSYLKNGLKKNNALRLAKLDYLEETTKTHPFYWAGFTATGDMSYIHFDSYEPPLFRLWHLIMALLLSFVGLYLWKFKTSSNS